MGKVEPAIVVPIYRLPLLSEEVLSINVLRSVFQGRYPVYFVVPENFDCSNFILKKNEVFKKFDDNFFRGISGYNSLMLSSCFYEDFKNFSHILIYQLDCLVFLDKLTYWCEMGYSYTAPPWFEQFNQKGFGQLWRVGNGGFSLRKVSSFLDILEKREKNINYDITKGFNPYYTQERRPEYFYYQPQELNKTDISTVEDAVKIYPYHEDLFWSFEAPKIDERFTICPPQMALNFGFEVAPLKCLILNWFRLPFGCHGWFKYGKKFWSYILKIKKIKLCY